MYLIWFHKKCSVRVFKNQNLSYHRPLIGFAICNIKYQFLHCVGHVVQKYYHNEDHLGGFITLTLVLLPIVYSRIIYGLSKWVSQDDMTNILKGMLN